MPDHFQRRPTGAGFSSVEISCRLLKIVGGLQQFLLDFLGDSFQI
jgi:hypothetical protein